MNNSAWPNVSWSRTPTDGKIATFSVHVTLEHTGACLFEIDDLFTPARKILPVPYIASYPALPTSSESTEVNSALFHHVKRFFLWSVNLSPYQIFYLCFRILYIADETYFYES